MKPSTSHLLERAVEPRGEMAAAGPAFAARQPMSTAPRPLPRPDWRDAPLFVPEDDAASAARAARELDYEIHRAIFNSMPASVAVIDVHGRVLEVNESWKQYAGENPLFGAKSGVGENYFDICAQVRGESITDAAIIARGLRTVLAGERMEFVHEYRCHLREDKRWFRLRASPFQGVPKLGAMLIYTDITKRGEAEESLREAVFKYQSIFENATEGIFQTTPDGQYLSANPMLARIYGYDSPEELMIAVKSIASQLYVNPERRNDFIQVLAEKGVVYKFESAIFRKDGKIIWISENARAVRDESGTVLYYEGTVEDITELKQAEERIRSQAALLDMARDAIMVQDLLHRVEYWNPSAARIYGWSAAEVLGQNAAGLIYRDPAQFNRALAVVLEKGGWSGEMKQARKDGTEVIVETSWTLVRDTRGQPRSILAINTDVTERKRLENQVAHTQRMESIGTLAGGIAHDFNNILSIITGYASLGRTTVPTDHPLQRSLVAVERAVERAQGVVRQILTFSRQKEPERRVIAVVPVVQEALQFLRSTLPAKIEIVSEFAPDLPPILADATQLHQILMNLGTNAAHAMRGHAGKLEVRVSAFDFEGSQGGFAASLRTGRYVRLVISDNGCGMDSRTLQRIFEPFFTTKNLGEGTGLGLAVVHGIVKNHDGAITVNSEVGKGTVFHLYFPALEAPEEQPKPVLAEAPCGQGRRVLYVDDEPGIVEVTTLNLQSRGFAACGFQFPEKALAAFRADPAKFDAAVLDLSMPRMEGPELARHMLAARPGLPIVVVSGYLRPDDQEKLRKLGIKHILEKPFSVTKLSAVLEQLLAAQTLRSP